MDIDKHYGHHLFDKNRGVVMFSNDLVMQQSRVQKAYKDLLYELSRLNELEDKLSDYIRDEWSEDEIKEAKERCNIDNSESVLFSNHEHPIQLNIKNIELP